MNKNFVIIHYNTPYLTECLVRSINLFVKDALIYIFDNSDKEPFTAKFDNVTILDNTKGQIIDFDKWLENYPNRKRSQECTRRFGSARHCYSVQKCIDILKEPFILLDSDVLLKKDISDLYDDNYVYCGKVITQPKTTIKRVLPYICYINARMCYINDIKFFDENYMHGLHKTAVADRYDTGSGFYINSSKYEHKEIEIDDYVVHYKAGSWANSTNRNVSHSSEYSINDWLSINKKLWNTNMNKKVIYTCITGNYDELITPSFINTDFDYICFTDNNELKSDVWQIRMIPDELKNLSQIKKQRVIKINTHKYLPEYELSVWVDGNILIRGDINELLVGVLEDDCSIYVPTHPNRNCIYAESSKVISMRKDVKETVYPQIDRYRKEGFPEKYGLLQSNILIRKHNGIDCVKLMKEWSEELLNGSHRDQLSFNYCCWKNKDIKVKYLDKKIYDSKWFKWNATHTRKRTTKFEAKPTPKPNQKATSRPLTPKEKIEINRKRINEIDERRKILKMYYLEY